MVGKIQGLGGIVYIKVNRSFINFMYLTHQKLSIHQTDSNENYYAFLSKQNEFSNCAK